MTRRMASLVGAGILSSEAADAARTEGVVPESAPPLEAPEEHQLAAIQRASKNPNAICVSATTRGGPASPGRAARSLVSVRVPVRMSVCGLPFRNGRMDEGVACVVLPQAMDGAARLVAEALSEQAR